MFTFQSLTETKQLTSHIVLDVSANKHAQHAENDSGIILIEAGSGIKIFGEENIANPIIEDLPKGTELVFVVRKELDRFFQI